MASSQPPKINDNSHSDGRKVPPPTPVKFPAPEIHPPETSQMSSGYMSVAEKLREVRHRSDLRTVHLEYLGLRLLYDANPEDVIPDSSLLPPRAWLEKSLGALQNADSVQTKDNGKLEGHRSLPGLDAFSICAKRLFSLKSSASLDLHNESSASHGHAVEFFKNLELMSKYWDDTGATFTSIPGLDDNIDSDPETNPKSQLKSSKRTEKGSSMPPEIRDNLLHALVRLVSTEFNCGLSDAHLEPRFVITTRWRKIIQSSWPADVTFIFRNSADTSETLQRPLAALSSRARTIFKYKSHETLDLAEEIVGILSCAQLRSRRGGPLAHETKSSRSVNEVPRKDNCKSASNDLTVFDAPGSSDSRDDFDDVFLLSALNHHLCCVRARVPSLLLKQLDGTRGSREEFKVWRSKWWDMFKPEDRAEAMRCIWGMLAFLTKGEQHR